MGNLKIRVYNLIRDDDENGLAANILDGFIISLVVLNIISIMIDTSALPTFLREFFFITEMISVIVFTLEYVLRLWTCTYINPNEKPLKVRIRYMFSFMATVDLLSILPFYLPFLIPSTLVIFRSLRLMRILRLFKLNRYIDSLKIIALVFKRKKHQLVSCLFILAILILVSSVLIYDVERSAQPDKFEDVASGIWVIITTITTVGYGDVYPVTVPGRVLCAITLILGAASLAIPSGIISAGFVEISNETNKSNKGKNACDKKICPHCGKQIFRNIE